MSTSKIASIYSIIVGVSMIGLWVMLLSTNQVPELAFEPYRIMAHIIAEFITGILLIVSGILLYTNRTSGLRFFLYAQGALLYTLIASPGYYIEHGFMPMVIMFLGLLIVNVIFLGLVLVRPQEFANDKSNS
jgi:peptidoglycan/LPS O-acetylase OafA/YrhL